MNVTEFKRIVSALSTYATVREKATGPQSLIGVQQRGGVIKLIAGSAAGGIVCVAGSGDSEDRAYTIQARPFLSAGKVIKGKLDLRINVTEEGLAIVTDKGGSLEVEGRGNLREAGFAKKPARPIARATIKGEDFKRLGKLFGAIQGDMETPPPTMDFTETGFFATAVTPSQIKAIYATLTAPCEGIANGAAYIDFYKSMTALEDDGHILFCEDGVVAQSGNVEIFSAPYRVSPWNPQTRKSDPPRNPAPLPVLTFRGTPKASFTIERRQLIDTVRGQAPNDIYNRVTLLVKNTALEVTSYGAESGFTIPVATSGEGVRSVNANYLMGLLRAIDSKEVTLSWGQSPAIKVDAEGYTNWEILAAPVALDK